MHKIETNKRINQLYTNPVEVPQLLIGSQKDKLVKYTDMLEYANIAKQKNINIRTKIYDDYEHCGIYRNHKEEYAKLVLDFANHVFNN